MIDELLITLAIGIAAVFSAVAWLTFKDWDDK